MWVKTPSPFGKVHRLRNTKINKIVSETLIKKCRAFNMKNINNTEILSILYYETKLTQGVICIRIYVIYVICIHITP